MPRSVDQLFAAAGLRATGTQAWGRPAPENSPGVYIIAMRGGPLKVAPLDLAKIAAWKSIAGGMTLAGVPNPSLEALCAALERFWHVDETILYVGLAGTSLKTRTGQFCRHTPGHNKPHAGGFWLKLLNDHALASAELHWATTPHSDQAEYDMLSAFEAACDSPADGEGEPLLPFANIKIELPSAMPALASQPRRRTKNHRLAGHTVDPTPRSPG